MTMATQAETSLSHSDNKRIVLASRPAGFPTLDNFRIETAPIVPPAEGQVLLETLYLSLDPYMRGRMSAAKSYAEPVAIGAVMEGGTVGRVILSRHPDYTQGDIVSSQSGWQSFALSDGTNLRKLDRAIAPPSTALGVLGMPGFTGYAGLLTIGRPQPGETVVVAAASGTVGAVVGQVARLKGAKAVGIAGGAEKCAFVRDELGFDVAVDHHAPDFPSQLAAACPNGIDVYFENVGGIVWDAVFPLLNPFARIPVCGLMAQYNDGPDALMGVDRLPGVMRDILRKSLTVRGFIWREYAAQLPDFLQQAGEWIAQGKLRYKEDFVSGLENAPAAFLGLLRGRNFGKLIVRVAGYV